MQTLNNVHEQFADFFPGNHLKPFVYQLSKKLSEGHICLELKELVQNVDFPIRYEYIADIERVLLAEPLVGSSFEEKQPFVLYNSRLYLHRYFAYESIILNRIKEFLVYEQANLGSRIASLRDNREFIRDLFPKEDGLDSLPEDEQIDWQKVAVLLALLNNFMIITGGPGTGKTFTVSKLLSLLKHLNPEIKVGLAAPTGKAAMRLAETLKEEEPGTIHRMLKTVYGTHRFKHNREFPLEYDIVIIDEASMIDVALFAKLLNAIAPHTRLILLGDKDQLASVEAGSMFRDLCQAQRSVNSLSSAYSELIRSFMEEKEAGILEKYVFATDGHLLTDHIIELKRSRRFDSRLGIGKFSKAVISGNEEIIRDFISPGHDHQVIVDMHYDAEVFKGYVSHYSSYILEEDIQQALLQLNKNRILCAVREGEHGIYQSNQKAEEILKTMGLIDPSSEFYCHRPIMLTKNQYDLGLYNGDIGIIRPDRDNVLMAWFQDGTELKAVLPARLDHIETVYAMTIHKSQGSEYESVLIVLPRNEEAKLLTRELVYTAVTRAKSSVIIQASENSLMTSASKSVKRASGIQERISSQTKDSLWPSN